MKANRLLTAALFASALLAGAGASAAAPEPTKPVPNSFFSGRWYEIARLPTKSQKDCEGSISQFSSANASGEFKVVQSCHLGALDGPMKSLDVTGKIMPEGDGAKFTLTFYKVVKQEYWVIDRGESLDWAVMATPGGNYAWLLSRKPTMPVAQRNAVVAKLKAAGYPVDKLIWPKQPAS